MTEKEQDGIFYGLCIVVGIQLLTVYLILHEFVLTLKNEPIKSFWILIPRTIASFYMHSALTGEIKSGLDIMKYVTNHPYLFKRRELEEDESPLTSENDGWYTRITYAFLLGFIQYTSTILLEMMTIVFLNSMGSYLFILICYAALSGVASFDNMYASAMSNDNPIKKGVGKKLKIEFHRFMQFTTMDEYRAQR